MLIFNRLLLASAIIGVAVAARGDGLTGSMSPQSGGGIGGFDGGVSLVSKPIVVVNCPFAGGTIFNNQCNIPFYIGGIFP